MTTLIPTSRVLYSEHFFFHLKYSQLFTFLNKFIQFLFTFFWINFVQINSFYDLCFFFNLLASTLNQINSKNRKKNIHTSTSKQAETTEGRNDKIFHFRVRVIWIQYLFQEGKGSLDLHFLLTVQLPWNSYPVSVPRGETIWICLKFTLSYDPDAYTLSGSVERKRFPILFFNLRRWLPVSVRTHLNQDLVYKPFSFFWAVPR